MSHIEEERQNAVNLLTQWLGEIRREKHILEGHIFGSVQRPRDFLAVSDIDLLLIVPDETEDPGFETILKKLSMLLNHKIDVTVFREEQIRSFSPLHRFSNLILSVGPGHPGLIGTLPECQVWFRPDFIRFWFWLDHLRSFYTLLKDHPGEIPGEEFFQRRASYAMLVEQKGQVTFNPSDSLPAYADLWSKVEWERPAVFADKALENLLRRAELIENSNVIVNAPLRSDVRFSFSQDETFFREMTLKEFCEKIVSHGKKLHSDIQQKLR